MTRADREREWRGRVAAAAVRAPAMLERVRLRQAEALSAGEASYYPARLREAGLEEVEEMIDRLAAATDRGWEQELEERRRRLGVTRMMPWDLGRPAAGAAPSPAEAAARLGFELANMPIDLVDAPHAATEVVAGRVRVAAPAGARRALLHELGHALLEVHAGAAGQPAPPAHEGVAELVAGLAPPAPGDALAELRLALARAAFERLLYVDEEPPDVVYWRCVERYVGVTCDDASGAWARLRHIETHPARLAAYVAGAAVAAHLRRAAGWDERRMGAAIRELARAGASVRWQDAVGGALTPSSPFSTEALEAELGASALVS